MKAIDSSVKTTGQAQHLVNDGYSAVGIYLRADRCNVQMLAELHQVGIRVWSIYERGFPIRDSYFTKAKGASDGKLAASFARSMGQPQGTQIYATVDYDPDDSKPSGPTINGPISDYINAFQAAIQPAGYVTSVYGSGRTCRILLASGLVKTGWLTQSTRYAEYKKYKAVAPLVQGPRINNSWDHDDVNDPTVVGLW